MKKFRKLILGSGIALALTASFAFKASKQSFTTVDAWVPSPRQCAEELRAEGNCNIFYHGPQCTVYYSATYPSLPALEDASPYCTYPVYLQN